MDKANVKRLPVTANIQNLIRIFVEYNSTDPYTPIREYIANAHDATLRVKEPRISIFNEGSCVIIKDNGTGMTEDVIINAFTQIAGTIKDSDNIETIGEFGIGVLSAFMIADRLEVITKSKEASQGIELTWDRGEAEFQLKNIPWEAIGTTAIMHVNYDFYSLTERPVLEKYIRDAFKFFDSPIYYGESNVAINKQWKLLRDLKNGPNKKLMLKGSPISKLLQSHTRHDLEAIFYIRQKDTTEIFLGIPKNIHQPLGMHDIHFNMKGIEIHGNVKSFFPENLAFMIGTVNSPHFHIMISKENFKQDETFHTLRQNIEVHILEFLERLGKEDQYLIQQIIYTHKEMLIAYGIDEPRIQKLLKKYHHFYTSAGQLLWKDILPYAHNENGKKILYTTAKELEAYQELMNMKGRQGYITIYAFNSERTILEQIARQDKITLVDTSVFETEGELKDVPHPFRILAGRISDHIIRLNIRGIVFVHYAKKQALPAMFRLRTIQNSSEKFDADPGMYIDALMLNIAHPLVRNLASIKNPSEEIIETASDVLYQIALIQSPFATSFSKISNEIIFNLIAFLELTIGVKKKKKELTDGKAHCFVAFAYQEEYSNVFEAIEMTLSSSPYFWKVIRGDQFINGEFLLESIKNHLGTSQRFIADISGLNPNVLIELGLMIADDPDALLILCDRETFQVLPSDLKGLLVLVYDKSLRKNVNEMYEWFKAKLIAYKHFVALQGSLIDLENN